MDGRITTTYLQLVIIRLRRVRPVLSAGEAVDLIVRGGHAIRKSCGSCSLTSSPSDLFIEHWFLDGPFERRL